MLPSATRRIAAWAAATETFVKNCSKPCGSLPSLTSRATRWRSRKMSHVGDTPMASATRSRFCATRWAAESSRSRFHSDRYVPSANSKDLRSVRG